MTSDTMHGPSALSLSGVHGQALQVVDGKAEVDYGVVRRLRRQVAEALAEQLVALRGRRQADVSPEDRAMLARSLIDEAVAD